MRIKVVSSLAIFSLLFIFSNNHATADTMSIPGFEISWQPIMLPTITTGCLPMKISYTYSREPGSVLTTPVASVYLLNGDSKSLTSFSLFNFGNSNSQFPGTNKGEKTVFVCPFELKGPYSLRFEVSNFPGIGEVYVRVLPFVFKKPIKSLKCVKKSNAKVLKTVTGVNPKCPSGYLAKKY